MRKCFMLIFMLQITFILGAKQSSTGDGIDIIAVHTSTQNGSESRSETISADITGHILTITFNDNENYITHKNTVTYGEYTNIYINTLGHQPLD